MKLSYRAGGLSCPKSRGSKETRAGLSFFGARFASGRLKPLSTVDRARAPFFLGSVRLRAPQAPVDGRPCSVRSYLATLCALSLSTAAGALRLTRRAAVRGRSMSVSWAAVVVPRGLCPRGGAVCRVQPLFRPRRCPSAHSPGGRAGPEHVRVLGGRAGTSGPVPAWRGRMWSALSLSTAAGALRLTRRAAVLGSGALRRQVLSGGSSRIRPRRPVEGAPPVPFRPRGSIARRRIVLVLDVLGRSDNAARCRAGRRGPAKICRTGPNPGAASATLPLPPLSPGSSPAVPVPPPPTASRPSAASSRPGRD